MRYQNVGAPLHLADGTVVERGQVFEPTPRELQVWRYKLQQVASTTPLGSSASVRMGVTAQPHAQVPSMRLVDAIAEWPLAMAPQMYLKLNPDGVHAAQARKIVGEGAESDG